MSYKKIRYSLLSLLFAAMPAAAQLVQTGTGVDSLTFAERLSVKTNAVDWLLLTPNISIEYDLKGYNWSRWAVQLNLKGNPQTSHTYTPGIVYNHSQARLEVRNYWRTRHLAAPTFLPHKRPWEKLVSTRRLKYPKNPKKSTAYFRGAYLSYDNFSFLLTSDGVQGSAIGAGVTYGLVKPFVGFNNGNSIDLELSVSAGVAYVKYDKYGYDEVTYDYPLRQKGLTGIIPSLTDLRVGFSYRFGDEPLYKRYRYRYDVDPEFQMAYDEKITKRQTKGVDNLSDQTYMKDMEEMFWDLYKKETGKKQVIRHKNRANRTGFDPDIASEKYVEANIKRAIADSLATVTRHERKTLDSLKELEVIERINYYDMTYKQSGNLFGIDIKKTLKQKRKARLQELNGKNSISALERKSAEVERKRKAGVERVDKLAAQEEALKAKAEAKAEKKAEEKKIREEHKAQKEQDRKARKEAAQQASESAKQARKNQQEEIKRQQEAQKAEMRRIKEEAKEAQKAAKDEQKAATEKLKAAQKAAEDEIKEAQQKAAQEKAAKEAELKAKASQTKE